ncbi:hypothetical protein AB46_5030 [Escherichia coli 3-267-03_S1_C2]|nr:hypothetical protein AB46_5030 [Escherichia coli 3-267-03_S1_C2]
MTHPSAKEKLTLLWRTHLKLIYKKQPHTTEKSINKDNNRILRKKIN